jgi:hypothetical protein
MKKFFFRLGSFLIKDDSKISFLEGKWLDDGTLRKQYSALYNIVLHKRDNIATLLESDPPNVTFRNDLVDQACIMECFATSIGNGSIKARGRRISVEPTREWQIHSGFGAARGASW